MANYFLLAPEVAGGLGDQTVLDSSVHPPVVRLLHYEVFDWLGDCIVQTFPAYLVLRDVGVRLEAAGFSGFRLADALVTESPGFRDMNPDGEIPDLVWLIVEGIAGVDGFGLTANAQLVVSEAVVAVFDEHGFSVGESAPWGGSE